MSKSEDIQWSFLPLTVLRVPPVTRKEISYEILIKESSKNKSL